MIRGEGRGGVRVQLRGGGGEDYEVIHCMDVTKEGGKRKEITDVIRTTLLFYFRNNMELQPWSRALGHFALLLTHGRSVYLPLNTMLMLFHPK